MSFFNSLFDLNKGYIHKDNILFLNNNLFIEQFDKNKLGYILNNLNDIEDIYRNDAHNNVALDKYYKFSTADGNLKVKYLQNDNGLYGRYQAKNSLSGQGMVREARHTIFKDYYVDLDIDNCHPVITKWLCNNLDIDCPYLKDYIFDREKHIKDLIKLNEGFDREHFKKVFLKLSYGCGDKSFNEMVKNKTKFIENFRNEILLLQEKISKIFYKFLEINTELRNAKNKKYNYYGSTLSHVCQFVENQLLMHIINYIKSQNLEIQDSILCFDGLMINKEKYKNDFINELEKYFENLDISLKFSIKSMNLDEYILKKCNYDETKLYIYYPYYNQKFINFNDEYYFKNFINDLICDKNGKQKNWDFISLSEFFIENVNRVLFIVLSQKNTIYGKYSSKTIEPIEATQHIIYYWTLIKNKLIIKEITFNNLVLKFYNHIKVYNNLEFIPYTKDDIPSNLDNNNFNLFQGFKANLLEKEDINLEIIKPILKHWAIVLANCDNNNFKYQLSYFHKIFKYPSKKTKVMMLFKSDKQQVGKGILLNKLIGELIFGNQIYKVNNGLSFINDRFNIDQSGALLNITEELSTIDDSYNSTFDRLKSLCCDDFLNVEPKFGKRFKIQNFTNYIFNTNNKFPVKIESGDARFAVFECDERFSGNYSYFNNLIKYINQETADHLYSHIYHINEDDIIDPRNIPKNDFYKSIQFNSFHNSIRFLYELKNLFLDNEYDYDSWENLYVEKFNKKTNLIKSSDINIIYKKWCLFNNEKSTSATRFKSYTSNFIKQKKNCYIYYDISTIHFLIDY
jgi:hypothetical protein